MPGKSITSPRIGVCSEIHSTVGLIVYEKDDAKKGMVVDCGVGADWEEIKQGIIGAGLRVEDITHVLLTHIHQDHIQNLKEFSGAIVITGGQASLLNQQGYGAAELCKDGVIEIPEVTYVKAPIAHTYRDTVYVVDSANEGVVAFLGDLIFGTQKHFSQEAHIAIDKSASIDPVARYLFAKDLLNTLPGVEKFYAGHNPEGINREEIKNYAECLRSQEFLNYLKEWYENRIREMGEEYEKITSDERL
ncbi:MAG: MBL fold metallo-hydrolase [bacterium]|nr:MBL fold metallo-hydrolase [bacterium]